ncbi:AMP-binding protein [Shewanella sp. OMA3-2]|uniref:AMP-binding protein n=1 Tax=Shewanella sp. OMA3-2 TaxID=2908650 RepID=UPI001F3987EF|nr:AMP-binding protein [Shewanella sp. OMA3-2]UJF22504.1 AMP-binding protein [Shewanella sp. OMA3-2]
MDNLLLNWLKTGPNTQQLISFNHHAIMTSTRFCAQVTYLYQQLHDQPAKRWLLAAKQSDLFAAGLCAGLLAGKTIILPANIQAGTITQLEHQFDAVIADEPICDAGIYIPLTSDITPPAAKWPQSAQLGELILFTSGSSGEAKAVKKSIAQLDAEVSTLERTFADHLPHCSVVSTVSHQHIYGLLFKILWPLAANRPFLSEQIEYPETLSYYLAIMPNLCLISSLAQLSRLPDALDKQLQHRCPSLIFSSGGPLSFEAATDIEQCYRQLPIEIFGSTETGGIAYRRQHNADEPWQIFSPVNIKQDEDDGALCIQSSYLENTTQWHKCDDSIELINPQQFTLLNRLDRIVKVEEKRISMVQMELLLCEHPLVLDAAVTILTKPRHMLGAIITLTDEGKKILASDGKLTINNLIKKHLLSQFERVTLPRRWRYPETIPQNSQGKRVQAELISLFKKHD